MYSAILNALGSFSDHDITLFQNEVKLRCYEKGELMLKKDEVQRSVFFMLSGAAYQFSCKPGEEENISDLYVQDQWLFNRRSFILQIPSDVSIAAYKPCSVLELTLGSIHYLIGSSPAFLMLNKVLESPIDSSYCFDNSLTPLQKYSYLMSSRPQLLLEFPLKMIAAYLKIAPETLSRARQKWGRAIVS